MDFGVRGWLGAGMEVWECRFLGIHFFFRPNACVLPRGAMEELCFSGFSTYGEPNRPLSSIQPLVVPRLNFCLRLQCIGSFSVFVFVNPWTGLSSPIRPSRCQQRSD